MRNTLTVHAKPGKDSRPIPEAVIDIVRQMLADDRFGYTCTRKSLKYTPDNTLKVIVAEVVVETSTERTVWSQIADASSLTYGPRPFPYK